MPTTVEYLDWSDRGFEKFEAGGDASKFGTVDIANDDNGLTIHLRRNTKTKRDLTIFVPDGLAELLWEALGGCRQ